MGTGLRKHVKEKLRPGIIIMSKKELQGQDCCSGGLICEVAGQEWEMLPY